MTDNRNRTASEVRSSFTKNGGSLGETGSVSFGFDRVGLVEYAADIGSEDEVMEAAIEAGAEDVESSEDGTVSTVHSRILLKSPKRWRRALGNRRV